MAFQLALPSTHLPKADLRSCWVLWAWTGAFGASTIVIYKIYVVLKMEWEQIREGARFHVVFNCNSLSLSAQPESPLPPPRLPCFTINMTPTPSSIFFPSMMSSTDTALASLLRHHPFVRHFQFWFVIWERALEKCCVIECHIPWWVRPGYFKYPISVPFLQCCLLYLVNER